MESNKLKRGDEIQIRLIMMRNGLSLLLRRGVFWKPKDFKAEYNMDDKMEQPLGHLPKRILEANKSKPRLLAPKKDDGKITVVFEIDEVLAYSFVPNEEGFMHKPYRKEDHYQWFQEYETPLHVYKRKNLDNFINYVTEECEPIIFSKAVPIYVDLMMKIIDPQKKIKHVFTQQHCDRIVHEPQEIDEFVKDLNLLNRDLSKTVYFDCRLYSYVLHPKNCFPTNEFRADNTQKDENLDYLILSLEEMRKNKDVRTYLAIRFELANRLFGVNLIDEDAV